MKNVRVFIDSNNFYYRILFASKLSLKLETQEIQDAYYESLCKSLYNLLSKFYSAKELYFIKDSASWRKKITAGYKESRKTGVSSDIDFEKMSLVQMRFEEFVKKIDGSIVEVPSCEADDIIFYKISKDTDCFDIIVSADKDFRQLLSDKCIQYDCVKNEVLYSDVLVKHDIDDILAETVSGKYSMNPVHPDREAALKVICGCPSDEVPGIPGIGEVKFGKIYDELSSMSKYDGGNVLDMLRFDVSACSKAISPYLKGKFSLEEEKVSEIIKRNLQLVILQDWSVPQEIFESMKASEQANVVSDYRILPAKVFFYKNAGIWKENEQQDRNTNISNSFASLLGSVKHDDDMSFIKD